MLWTNWPLYLRTIGENPPCVERTTADTQASNVIVKSAVHTLVGRADAFTLNKIQGTFYILKGKWGNRIILVSPSPLFNKQICISGMVSLRELARRLAGWLPFFRKDDLYAKLLYSSIADVHSCVHLFVMWPSPLRPRFVASPPPPRRPLPSCPSSSSSLVFLFGFNRNNNGP